MGIDGTSRVRWPCEWAPVASQFLLESWSIDKLGNYTYPTTSSVKDLPVAMGVFATGKLLTPAGPPLLTSLGAG